MRHFSKTCAAAVLALAGATLTYGLQARRPYKSSITTIPLFSMGV
jgi:hypothetical protein